MKKILYYAAISIFWICIAATFFVGCFNTFFASTDEKEDYEEYIHSIVP